MCTSCDSHWLSNVTPGVCVHGPGRPATYSINLKRWSSWPQNNRHSKPINRQCHWVAVATGQMTGCGKFVWLLRVIVQMKSQQSRWQRVQHCYGVIISEQTGELESSTGVGGQISVFSSITVIKYVKIRLLPWTVINYFNEITDNILLRHILFKI